MMTRFLLWLVVFVISMPVISIAGSADGGGFVEKYNQWVPVNEDEQFAIIDHENGYQSMIITVSVSRSSLFGGTKAVWLFPIPASAYSTDIYLSTDVPKLAGTGIQDTMESRLISDFGLIYSSQLFTVPFVLPLVFNSVVSTSPPLSPSFGGPSLLGPSDYGVDVVDRIETDGVTVELMDVQSSSGLNAYFDDKDLDLPTSAYSIIEEYIPGDYSFVAFWVSNISRIPVYSYNSVNLLFGVGLKFPTEYAYFPMRLTSIYGEDRIPIRIQILGKAHMINDYQLDNLDIVEDICIDDIFSYPQSCRWFFQNQQDGDTTSSRVLYDVKFTDIQIDNRAELYDTDLWFEEGASAKMQSYVTIAENSWIITIPIFFSLSVIASLLSNVIIFRNYKLPRKIFVYVGLLNIFTLLGVAAGYKLFDLDRITGHPLTETKFWRFLMSFAGIFLLLSVIANILILLAI